MLDHLWFPLLDRLYQQISTVWNYLEARGELDNVKWKKACVSKRDYIIWSIVNGELWNQNTRIIHPRFLALCDGTILTVDGKQYKYPSLGPVKRLSLLEFIIPCYLNIPLFPILKLNELRCRLHNVGAKHKFRVMEVSQVHISLQLSLPHVLMDKIYQVVYEVRQ